MERVKELFFWGGETQITHSDYMNYYIYYKLHRDSLRLFLMQAFER